MDSVDGPGCPKVWSQLQENQIIIFFLYSILV